MSALDNQLDRFLRKPPQLGSSVFIAKGAVVVGDVTLARDSSVWYNAVIRGDINAIRIGKCTNIQDNAVLHVSDDFKCIVGDYVTVGHSAILHACQIGDKVLIGMGAVVMDGAQVGDQCLIGAKALVARGTIIPEGSLVMGVPAKVVRLLTLEERENLRHWADKYVDNAAYCLKNAINVSGPC
ncbi:MAG TPA: gamma carbonic anhydrase family protein [Verrucomicrobiales bacterium]|jgi:carbonic anhydrase/acetyltransferase-like protein (isoleucine patch superfamily)|nr:gamma carbonic anhydrase family protein [Verrucomicrobiales bacterium]HIL68822.1 gamma carbonic anhydrase family protein [Verrucomicrobiota bacterium]